MYGHFANFLSGHPNSLHCIRSTAVFQVQTYTNHTKFCVQRHCAREKQTWAFTCLLTSCFCEKQQLLTATDSKEGRGGMGARSLSPPVHQAVRFPAARACSRGEQQQIEQVDIISKTRSHSKPNHSKSKSLKQKHMSGNWPWWIRRGGYRRAPSNRT